MDTKKISVIVPVYNTVEELPICIQSILDQTYPNLEIILVDDGSIDGSQDVVDEYAYKDSRIKVIHQENQGESKARNVGIEKATGEYIAFVDCDDWLELEAYEKLMHALTEFDADMACGSWVKEEKNTTEKIKNRLEVKQGLINNSELLNYIYKRDDYKGFAYMWNKVYKKNLVVYYPQNLRLGGDVLFLANAALRCNKAVYIDEPVYHYKQREQSGCHTKDLEKLNDWITAYRMVLELFLCNNVDKVIIEYVQRFMAYHASNFTEEAIRQNDQYYVNSFRNIMRENKDVYIKLNIEHQDRVKRYLLLMGE